MNKLISTAIFSAVLFGATFSAIAQSSFTAYYTKVTQGQTWEASSRTGKYADLIVRIDANMKLIFWRGNSYLPYLETTNGTWNVPEVVPRSGDGSGSMPDLVNTYAHVRLITVNKDSAVVHWRYLPSFGSGNPKTNEDHRKMVDEVFTIFKNGSVKRVIRKGDESYDNWVDPLNRTIQTFDLSASGILNVNTTNSSNSPAPGPITGNPVQGSNVVTPFAWWSFDEAQGSSISENISKSSQTIGGHKTNWKKGISGTSLALDGYNSFITLPNANAPTVNAGLTVEGWIALGALPWIDQAIVHKGNSVINDEVADDSYGLYVDEFGDIFGRVVQGSTVTYIFGGEKLPIGQWAHVAMVVNTSAGTAKTYINGEVVGNETIPNASLATVTNDLSIGWGIADAGWHFTLDGLMDEFKIYNSALTDEQIEQTYNNFNPGATITQSADMDKRIVPEGTTTGKFGARYEHLSFYDTWDQLFRDGEYSDIVIEYDDPNIRTVFWRGASYSPFHSNGAKGRFNSEFNENFGLNDECCYEPMSDKQHLYSHARVIENTPARVVVHWRYPQLFPDHTINHFNANSGWGDWSDWYMYIYPDGMNAYEMVWWATDNTQQVEWAEPMLLLGPGEMPLDILPSDLKKMVTNYTQTTKLDWDWSRDWNVIDLLHNSGEKPEVQTINLTNTSYRPVMVYDHPNLATWGPYNDFNRYNHWPVGQKPTAGSDDYNAGGSRTGHTAMLKPIPVPEGYQMGNITNGGWKKNLRLEGMSNRDDVSLRRLYRSWQNAPALSNMQNVSGAYALEQRAYELTATGTSLAFTVDATNDRPLDNPCFVIKNWQSEYEVSILINGEAATGAKQGITTNTDGKDKLIVYIPMEASAATAFTMEATQSTATDILSFAVPVQVGNSTIDDTNHTVNLSVPSGTNLTALTPTISVSSGATITPASGVSQDFTSPVTYRVVAQDGISTQTWTVTVGQVAASTETDILSFELTQQIEQATIDKTNHTVMAIVETGTDLSTLAPTISVSAGASISPSSGSTQDFNDPVTYNVTAENGTTQQDWEVSVTVEEVPLNTEKELGWKIYPNPTDDILHIETEKPVKITLTDLLGRSLIPEREGINLKLQLSTFKPGIYVLTIRDGAKIHQHKIIRTRGQ